MAKRSTPPPPELIQGTLEVMILRTLSRAEAHGYAIAREIELLSGNVLAVEEGSLYPALYRMHKRGDLSAEWRISDSGRRAKFYKVTTKGRKRLAEQLSMWERLSGAVDRVLGPSPEVAT